MDNLLAVPVGEASARVGISRSQFYKEVKAGRIRLRKVGRRSLVEVAELQRWLDSLETAQPSPAA